MIQRLGEVSDTEIVQRPNSRKKIQTKVLRVFSSCYSQSPLQLCLEIPVSSNSRNLLQFPQFSYSVQRLGEDTIARRRGGWGVNILEDARHRIALLQ
jgi:hypothetical protein